MTAQQVGHQAWRWDPTDRQAAGHLTAMLDTDGVDILLSGRREDGIALTITTRDSAGYTARVTALPGDWLARTPGGTWSVIPNPDHAARHPTQDAYQAACSAFERHRATIGRLVRLHNNAVAECRRVIPVTDLGRALDSQALDTRALNGNHTQEGQHA